MFELTKQKSKLSSVNPLAELHGEDKKLAVDLVFEMKVSNDVLSFFDPSLKSALYKANYNTAGQAELIQEAGHLPQLKFPKMGAIKCGYEGAGYEVTVHYGVSGKDDIRLTETQIDGFKFDCQDGGTVGVRFRVIAHPDTPELGRLCELIQREVDITVEPPSAEAQQDLKEAD